MTKSRFQVACALCVLFVLVKDIKSESDFVKCEGTWKKVGCFKDRVGIRALPEQLVNNRDPQSKVFDGKLLDWTRLSDSFQSLACQCAEVTSARGFRYFGLQFYGECWSGNGTYNPFGEADASKCVMDLNYHDEPVTWQYCDMATTKVCVGQDSTNFVYELQEPNSPVNGEWSDWDPWTPCDKTCGIGEQIRERKCANPPPSNGGADCLGPHEEVKQCKLTECPIDGGFTPWQPDGECSKTCGGGEQQFSRSCTNPPPQFGGKDCEGPEQKTEICYDFPCPIPCHRALDLGVILDATRSVKMANFNISKEFVVTLARSMPVSADGTHMGIITFHYKATLRLGFNDLAKQNPQAVEEVLKGVNFLGSPTRTDIAIELADTDLFVGEKGDRPDKPDVLIVFTDGQKHVDSKDFETVLKPLKERQVTVIAVGVGGNIKHEELKNIAMGNENNVIQVSDFKSLFDKLQPIIDSSCLEK